jgi:hypothetical protein
VPGVRPASSRAIKPAASRSANPLDRIGRQIPLPIPVPDWSKPIIAALALLALLLAVRASLAGARARRLERQRAGLLRDVGAMQAALVPEVPPQLGGLQVSVAYRPAEGPAAGGDFYDLFVPRPGFVAIMLGDVSGHGHDALTHAALTRYTLRAYLQAGMEPRMALALAGRVLSHPSGSRYATVALALYEEATGTLTYALAGHPPPMLLGPAALEPATACSSPPVGWGIPTGRRQTSITMPQGSQACFFSDGLIEARRDGQLLGRDKLGEILAGLGGRPVAETLLEEVRSTAEGAPDDMVACIVSPQASPATEQRRIEELELDSRAIARPALRRFLRECSMSPDAIARLLNSAARAVGSSGSALLRIEISPHGSVATVSDSAVAAGHAGSAGVDEALASVTHQVGDGARQVHAVA